MKPDGKRPAAAVLIAFLIVTALFLPPHAAAANSGRTVAVAINLPPSLLGEGAADFIGQLNRLIKTARAKTGISFRIDIYREWDDVIAALNSGKAGLAWLPPYYYARHKARNKKSEVTPLVVYETGGAARSRACLYVRKDSGFNGIDGLVARSVAFADEEQWVLLNKIFDDINYPFPPQVFFGRHEEITRESAAYALYYKEIDAIVLEEPYLGYIERNLKNFRHSVKALACARPHTNLLIAAGADISGDRARALKKLFTSMSTDKAFAPFRNYFRISNGRWAGARPGAFADWTALYNQARKKGWLDDYRKLKQ